MPTTRCPKGSRKDKNGNCVEKNTNQPNLESPKKNTNEPNVEIPKNNTKRCPKGYRRNKTGDCVDNNTTKKTRKSSEKKKASSEKKKASSETKTPRSIYAKRYFANNKSTIHLLDKFGDSKKVMVQVNYNDVEQFMNYRNLANRPESDCFFQTIFSLGLRDVKMAKQDSMNSNITGEGASISEIIPYIKNTFNLSNAEKVGFKRNSLAKEVLQLNTSKDKINDKIVKLLTPLIKEGYAAPISIMRYNKRTGKQDGHSMIAYKYNNVLYFFDPQKKFSYVTIGNIFNSTNIFDVAGCDIIAFGYYTVTNLDHPKPLMNTTCKIKK